MDLNKKDSRNAASNSDNKRLPSAIERLESEYIWEEDLQIFFRSCPKIMQRLYEEGLPYKKIGRQKLFNIKYVRKFLKGKKISDGLLCYLLVPVLFLSNFSEAVEVALW